MIINRATKNIYIKKPYIPLIYQFDIINEETTINSNSISLYIFIFIFFANIISEHIHLKATKINIVKILNSKFLNK